MVAPSRPPVGTPTSDAELEALSKSFINAVNAYEAHAAALELTHWQLHPTRPTSAVLRDSIGGVRYLPVVRARVAQSFLTGTCWAIVRSQDIPNKTDRAFAEAIHRYQAMIFSSPTETGESFLARAIRGERDAQDKLRRTIAGGVDNSRSALAQTDQFGGAVPSNSQLARYQLYVASQVLSSALYQIDGADFTRFVQTNRQIIDTLEIPPLPFANMFIYNGSGLVSRDPRSVGYAPATFQFGSLIIDGDQHADLMRAEDPEEEAVGARPLKDAPQLSREMAAYLHWSSARRQVLPTKEPVPADGDPAKPPVPADPRGRATRETPIAIVETRGWAGNIRKQKSAGTMPKPRVEPGAGKDRRGGWVGYGLTIDAVRALGLTPSPDPNARHFWIGWRVNTRVNDPVYKATPKEEREQPLIPDNPQQVRTAIPPRPDMPLYFNRLDVYAQTGTDEAPVFTLLGSHPRYAATVQEPPGPSPTTPTVQL